MLFKRPSRKTDTNGMKLGDLLLKAKMATQESVDAAHAKQAAEERETGKRRPLGVILVEQNACRQCDIDAALRAQSAMVEGDKAGGLMELVRERIATPTKVAV